MNGEQITLQFYLNSNPQFSCKSTLMKLFKHQPQRRQLFSYSNNKKIVKMQDLVAHRKNKQQMSKLHTLIKQYQGKLDNRVDQVISEILNRSKRVSEATLFPEIPNKQLSYSTYNNKISSTKRDMRNKSLSSQLNISYINEQNHENKLIETLKANLKRMQQSKIAAEPGRAVGHQKIIRPRFTQRRPDILPKQLRMNPFVDRNAIKAHDLEKGLLSLIEKGKIGRDVNIITAFEKGIPILQAQKAIFHHGEERFAELDAQKIEVAIQNKQKEKQTKKHIQHRQRNYQQNWALTMPKDEQYASFRPHNRQQTNTNQQLSLQTFATSFYIKVLHYQIVQDQNYNKTRRAYIDVFAQIRQILQQLVKLMRCYCIDLAYVDSKKIVKFVTCVTRIGKQELVQCIVGCNKGNLKLSIKNIRGELQRKHMAIQYLKSSMKAYLQKNEFRRYLQKKKICNNIYRWVVRRIQIKKQREQITRKSTQRQLTFSRMQQQFKQAYTRIQRQKHYQIHISNQSRRCKQDYPQVLNIQITRIFNLQNPNKHIIYMLCHKLDEQTISYYYKIMELQEIPNYRDRVTFVQADPDGIFGEGVRLSGKFYYNSKVLRTIRGKVKDHQAYLVISYPSIVDVRLATFLGMPIMAGNLLQLEHLEKKSEVLSQFKVSHLPHHIVHPSSTTISALSNQIRLFCTTVKSADKFVVKLNHKYQSTGIALLTFPFLSILQMYQNTTMVMQGKQSVDEFYHNLIKYGGIVEKYEENMSTVTVVVSLSPKGQSEILGTFDKISAGFINIAYTFPQKSVTHKSLMFQTTPVIQRLIQCGHFGYVQITYFVIQPNEIYLDKVQCYLTLIGNSLFYFKFLSEGYFNLNGEYLAKIIYHYDPDNKEQEIIKLQSRCFCFVPYLLHFGFSARQVSSFFQLCRIGGVSFDLQNKSGATFILLGSLKSSLGIITTSKESRNNVKLMLKSLQFILKQNSHNMSAEMLAVKQIRMRERENVSNIKQRLENL